MEFADHLWLLYLDQPQSDVVVFCNKYFQIYNILVKKWKHVIGPNGSVSFNEELENISTSIIKLDSIDESSH